MNTGNFTLKALAIACSLALTACGGGGGGGQPSTQSRPTVPSTPSAAKTATDTAIAEVHVSDTMATTPASSVVHSPEAVPGKVIALESAGWLMPGSGVAFTWTLNEELPQTEQPEAAASSREG